MHRPKRIKVTDVNPFLICVLCGGYYIDATTIIECLHSFCRSCIVKYLQKNKYCPICDVQIHKSTPLQNIRNDKTLQTIVYKLVPSLFQNEMRRRIEFFRDVSEKQRPSDPEARGQVGENTNIILPDEAISICLEYQDPHNSSQTIGKRYLHCPAAVRMCHLYKLIRGKFSLTHDHSVQIYFKDDLLPDSLSVMDLAYTYQWRRKGPIHLNYRIMEVKKKWQKSNEIKENKEWKEVELQISENGVMTVRGVDGDLSNTVSNLVKNTELEVVAVEPNQLEANKLRITAAKGEALNRIVSRLSPNERLIGNTSVSIRPVPNTSVSTHTTPHTSSSKPPTPSVLSLFKQGPPCSPIVVGNVTVSKEAPAQSPKDRDTIPRVSVSLTKEPSPKPKVQNYKYKTLKFPSKTWNPTIDKSTILSMKQNTGEPNKPPKFFKARNNMPRYLGNPADGVKPMYQIGDNFADKLRSPRPPPYTPGSPKRTPNPYTVLSRMPSPAHGGSFPSYPILFPNYLRDGSRFPPPDLLRSMFHPSLLIPPLRPPAVQPIPPTSKPQDKQVFPLGDTCLTALKQTEKPLNAVDRTINNNIEVPLKSVQLTSKSSSDPFSPALTPKSTMIPPPAPPPSVNPSPTLFT